jgi:hypothetical protein
MVLIKKAGSKPAVKLLKTPDFAFFNSKEIGEYEVS